MPVAIEVSVSSSLSGGPVDGASLAVSGGLTSSLDCASSCVVPGLPGTYQLTLSAPGFQTIQQSVEVHGSTPQCGCPMVETERVSLVLHPTS